jgi:hypothetical protein
MELQTQRTCPACSSDQREHIGRIVSPTATAQLDFDELSEYWRGFRRRQCFFDYERCSTCGLLYCPSYFTQEALDALYASMDDNTAGEVSEVLSRTQARYIDFLREHSSGAEAYLEIGPDIGLSSRVALQNSTIRRAVFVEPNRDVHPALRELASGISCTVTTDLELLTAASNANEAVLVHVLDHLLEPVAYLENLVGHLAPGAIVLIVVHNEQSILRKLLRTKWPPFCLQHPQLYSPNSLETVLGSSGLDVIDVRPTTNVFTLRHCARMAGDLVGFGQSLARFVPRMALPIRLGNIMAVARRRG